MKMNIEDYREYCLSLGEDIEEKLPFQKFKSGEGVLVFYVMGHMFSFFDCNDFSVISLKYYPFSLYSLGVMPVLVLKKRLKEACSENPRW